MARQPSVPTVGENVSHATEEFQPRLGTYHYKITWGKSDIAEARIAVDKQDDLYQVTLKARTQNMVDRMFKLRYRGEGQVSAEDFAPVHAYFQEETRSKQRETMISQVNFLPG